MQGLSEILNSREHLQSENQSILICLEVFICLWMHYKCFRIFLGLVTFSQEQTNLTVCSRGQIERSWKEAMIGVG